MYSHKSAISSAVSAEGVNLRSLCFKENNQLYFRSLHMRGASEFVGNSYYFFFLYIWYNMYLTSLIMIDLKHHFHSRSHAITITILLINLSISLSFIPVHTTNLFLDSSLLLTHEAMRSHIASKVSNISKLYTTSCNMIN